MLPGGITEVLWHFAGYLKIIDDIARDRIVYDESPFRNPQDDYVTPRPDYDYKPDFDDLDSQGLKVPDLAPFDELHHARFHPIRSPSPPPTDTHSHPSGALPALPLRTGGGGGGGGGHDHRITVQYQEGGEQTQLEIHQYNIMSDNDLVVLGCGTAVTCEARQLTVDAEALLKQMADGANAQIPGEWWFPQNGTGVTEFLKTHGQDLAANNGAPDTHSVEPGYYLNGVLQAPAPTPPDHAPADPPAPAPDFGHGIGQWAVVGDNSSFNAALIVDLSESGRSMIVMGDYFKTNAVFQTNSTMDHDHVAAMGGNAPGDATGNNTADNVADFVQHPGIYDGVPAHFAGPNWHVDVVDGDYYSIHTVVQMNYMLDNDVIVQASADNHYELYAGQNEQGNLAEIFDGTIHYDLIIVEGAYHGMNVIFQNNILLNDDDIRLLTQGTDPSQSVVSGENELTNEATIESYGDDHFLPMNDDLNNLVIAVGGGLGVLDPSYGNFVDGSGGVFNVLYIKGDYYDVNAIWQTNVTSDVNLLVQLLDKPSADAAALHPDDAGTQSVISGSNSLSNDAAIVDVGATNTYVNGEVYGDTILVQANLLPSDPGHMLAADTQKLVPELIAFVNEAHDETPAAQPIANSTVHDDAMANVMH
jgi:hypothetical protein